MAELTRGQPLYKPKLNPHNFLQKQGQDIWQCVYCGQTGTLEALDVLPCPYLYPPCPYCGLTPICAVDCKGMWQIINNPKICILGAI